jgi:hypothetical protein
MAYFRLPMSSRILFAVAILTGLVSLGSPAAAQRRKAHSRPQASYFAADQLKSFYGTYQYTAYTVFDNTTDAPPTPVQGVGGTLLLRPDGSYAKRLSITRANGPMYFNQDGRFTIKGDSIRFAFTDRKGADVQRGTFRFDPQTQVLEITLLGYPSGNKGVYELVAQPAATPAK